MHHMRIHFRNVLIHTQETGTYFPGPSPSASLHTHRKQNAEKKGTSEKKKERGHTQDARAAKRPSRVWQMRRVARADGSMVDVAKVVKCQYWDTPI